MQVHPYLTFEGRAEEAARFYEAAIDAQLINVMRFKESPEAHQCGPMEAEKVMHMTLKIGESVIFVSDGRCSGKSEFRGCSLSLSVGSTADAERCFSALSEGGQVQMPLEKTFFSALFGMVEDRFGVSWMVIVEP